MAYNRRNLLLRVKEVNEIYVREHSRGVTNEDIYRNYIRDRFHISRTAFYQYLTIPYARQLRELEERAARADAEQPRLPGLE